MERRAKPESRFGKIETDGRVVGAFMVPLGLAGISIAWAIAVSYWVRLKRERGMAELALAEQGIAVPPFGED